MARLLKIAISLILIALAFQSCSPEAKLKRANKKLYKLLKEYPELSRHDTVWKEVKVKVDGVIHDTIFDTRFSTDTITIIDKQLTIKYVNDGKKTYIKGICDTVFKEIKVPLTITTIQPGKEIHVERWWNYLSYALALIGLALIIFRK